MISGMKVRLKIAEGVNNRRIALEHQDIEENDKEIPKPAGQVSQLPTQNTTLLPDPYASAV
jgi:hypothetical protein